MSDPLLMTLCELARNSEPDALSDATVSLSHPDLYNGLVAAFGGWDIALAAALKRSLGSLVPAPVPKRLTFNRLIAT